MSLWDLKIKFENFIVTVNTQKNNFSGLLTIRASVKFNDRWRIFKDAAIEFSAGKLLFKAIQANGSVVRLLNLVLIQAVEGQ
ncbi:hypothetical protein FGIG_07444 [Fasciola gigantica]|uniref:Uncharacterized protein n=1 Tax=Fasciola gigantica TaxID=46835 RepID=A0A504Y9M4_FASGI|nr:hypothetical protein FGIG_07444 [Fasciola gigantica]